MVDERQEATLLDDLRIVQDGRRALEQFQGHFTVKLAIPGAEDICEAARAKSLEEVEVCPPAQGRAGGRFGSRVQGNGRLAYGDAPMESGKLCNNAQMFDELALRRCGGLVGGLPVHCRAIGNGPGKTQQSI